MRVGSLSIHHPVTVITAKNYVKPVYVSKVLWQYKHKKIVVYSNKSICNYMTAYTDNNI